MTSLKHCPLCRRPPELEVSYIGYRLRCPGCGDCAVRWNMSYDGAAEDWNDGITPEYVEEVSE